MKRLFLTAVVALVLAAPALMAQGSINEKGIKNKIERSDADIVNPKKSGNAATWIARGQVMYEAATEVSKNLYDGIDAVTVMSIFGQPTGAEEVVIEGVKFNKGSFSYVDVYLDPTNKPISWIITKEIYPNALEKAVEAYNKAYELGGTDKKVAEKVNAGLKAVYDEYSKTGALYYALSMFGNAGDMFVKAYELTKLPGLTVAQSDVSVLMHDAGLAYLFGHDYKKSIEYLTAAEESGYNQSDIYYLIYHAYRGTAAEDNTALATAKGYLEKGLGMHPSDSKIIESLSEAYVLLGENPDTIISIVETSAQNNPSADMWSALGVLYVSKENYDKAAEAFLKMVELQPESYIANNNLGIVYIKKAEVLLEDINSRAGAFANYQEQEAEQMKAFEVYAQAVPWLEKAYQIDPNNMGTLELLKNVTFRIRDLDGMMAKYEKYNTIWKSMQK